MSFVKNYVLGAALAIGAAMTFGSTPAEAAINRVIGQNVKLVPTSGTTSIYTGFSFQGTTRNVLIIRPNNLPAGGRSPAIVMLHYDTGTPELQANGTHAGSLAAKMGFWVILPPAINGHWNDDPANDANATADDVGFLAALLKALPGKYPIDSHRISMNGLSNGGFMAERFACAHPQMLASVVAVAADMRDSLAAICQPSRPVPMVYVNGTADPLVPYNGSSTVASAPNSYSYWMGLNACNSADATTTTLPILVNDGTSVVLQHNAACTSLGEADLYTVVNGGHAWPGASFSPFGTASKNLDTTTMIGTFAKRWTNSSTI
jgi:polyhydroxybutyrate depolymerase